MRGGVLGGSKARETNQGTRMQADRQTDREKQAQAER